MAELKNFDIVGSFQRGQQIGTQQRLVKDGEQRRNMLAELAGQAYGAPAEQRQGLVQKAIATDPEAGFALNKGLEYDDDRRSRTMVNMSKMLISVPEQARPMLYQRMAAEFPAMGMQGFPTEYTPETKQLIDGTAQSIVQAYSQNSQDTTPADIRSLQMLRDNPELAALDKDRRTYSGMVPKLVQTSQGIGWGTPGAGIELAPMQGVADGSGVPPVESGQLFAALGQKYGLQPTSVRRSPDKNAEVGGVTNSYHLTGQAADWVVPQQQKAQFMADARSNGFEAIDEGDHIHIEPARRGAAPAAGGGVAQPYQAPQRDTVPSGWRTTPDGGLEPIPGGPADKPEPAPKPLPPSILRMRRESREALSLAEGLGSDIAGIADRLRKGEIKLGPLNNLTYRGLNAAGASSSESRAYQSMVSTFEKMRNDSLRLNNGVQTEGDAQRAWDELLGNLSDNANVVEQLSRIQTINQRAIQLHMENMDEIDAEYGARGAPGRQQGPEQGSVEDGYRFRGGDPGDPNSWERM